MIYPVSAPRTENEPTKGLSFIPSQEIKLQSHRSSPSPLEVTIKAGGLCPSCKKSKEANVVAERLSALRFKEEE